MRAPPMPILSCLLLWLWWGSPPTRLGPPDAGAAFERALFTGSAADGDGLPIVPAGLRRPCGGLGMDRPFGLDDLAGHRLEVAVPVGTGGLAVGVGQRGPPRHRERGAWIGAGLRPASRLEVGAALHVLAWRGTDRAGQAGWAPVLAAGLDLAGGWRLQARWRRASTIVPGRAGLWLRRRTAAGAVSAAVEARPPRRPVPALGMVVPAGRRLDLTGRVRGLGRVFGAGATVHGADLALHVQVDRHAALGPTPSAWVGRPCR